MKHRIGRRWPAFAAAVVVAIAGVTLAPASAATLGVQNSRIVLDSANACTETVLATTTAVAGAGQTTLRVNNVPLGCENRTMNVWLLDGSDVELATGQLATTVQGQNTVTVTNYTTSAVASVIVTIDGWWIDTTWTAPNPPPTATKCEAINPSGAVSTAYTCNVTITPNGGPPWGYDNGYLIWDYGVNVSWMAAPPSGWRWRVTVNHSVTPPFPGFMPQFVGTYFNPGVTLAPGYSCAQLPVLVLQSASAGITNIQLNIGNGPPPSYFGGQVICS